MTATRTAPRPRVTHTPPTPPPDPIPWALTRDLAAAYLETRTLAAQARKEQP